MERAIEMVRSIYVSFSTSGMYTLYLRTPRLSFISRSGQFGDTYMITPGCMTQQTRPMGYIYTEKEKLGYKRPDHCDT